MKKDIVTVLLGLLEI